ncbi:unnamed protein product [Arctogadus glacialis]
MVMSCNKGGLSHKLEEEGHRQEAAGDLPPPPEHQPTLSGKQGMLKVQGGPGHPLSPLKEWNMRVDLKGPLRFPKELTITSLADGAVVHLLREGGEEPRTHSWLLKAGTRARG